MVTVPERRAILKDLEEGEDGNPKDTLGFLIRNLIQYQGKE